MVKKLKLRNVHELQKKNRPAASTRYAPPAIHALFAMRIIYWSGSSFGGIVTSNHQLFLSYFYMGDNDLKPMATLSGV